MFIWTFLIKRPRKSPPAVMFTSHETPCIVTTGSWSAIYIFTSNVKIKTYWSCSIFYSLDEEFGLVMQLVPSVFFWKFSGTPWNLSSSNVNAIRRNFYKSIALPLRLPVRWRKSKYTRYLTLVSGVNISATSCYLISSEILNNRG